MRNGIEGGVGVSITLVGKKEVRDKRERFGGKERDGFVGGGKLLSKKNMDMKNVSGGFK